MKTQDTICALATAPLPAGVAVIRISGPQAWAVAGKLCSTFANTPARTAHYGDIVSICGNKLVIASEARQSLSKNVIDSGIIIGFKAPNSFTGEDVVEIQCHGSNAVIKAILESLTSQPNIRHAEAGEFTRRAFMNNKLDLTQAEGLADLIAAETEEQRKQAKRQLDGELGNQFEKWRLQIMELLAETEAGIDFPDEELEILADAKILDKISTIIAYMEKSLANNAGERLREGFKIAILGKPNAGKSTLLNLLTGKQTAIVSPTAGTTRDVVETHLNIGGFPVIIADTAGLRKTQDSIEKEGVKRATQTAQKADLIIAVIDATEHPKITPEITKHLTPKNSLVIFSKIDETKTKISDVQNIKTLGLNLTDEKSLSSILKALEKLIKAKFAQSQNGALITRQRQRSAISSALKALQNTTQTYQNSPNNIAELIAEDLRIAANEIGQITGRTTNEDMLDIVFSKFCVGK